MATDHDADEILHALRNRRDALEAQGAAEQRLDALTYAMNALSGKAPRTRRPLREAELLDVAVRTLDENAPGQQAARAALMPLAEEAWDGVTRYLQEPSSVVTPLDREGAARMMQQLGTTFPAEVAGQWPPEILSDSSRAQLAQRVGEDATRAFAQRTMQVARTSDADFALIEAAQHLTRDPEIAPEDARALTALSDAALAAVRGNDDLSVARPVPASTRPLGDMQQAARAVAVLQRANIAPLAVERATTIQAARSGQVTQEFWQMAHAGREDVALAGEMSRQAARQPGADFATAMNIPADAVLSLLVNDRPDLVAAHGPAGARQVVQEQLQHAWREVMLENGPDVAPEAGPGVAPEAESDTGPRAPGAHRGPAGAYGTQRDATPPSWGERMGEDLRGALDDVTLGERRRMIWRTLKSLVNGDPLSQRATRILRGAGAGIGAVVGTVALPGFGTAGGMVAGAAAGTLAAEWFLRRRGRPGELVRDDDYRLQDPALDDEERMELQALTDQRLYQDSRRELLARLTPEQRHAFAEDVRTLQHLEAQMNSPLAQQLARFGASRRGHVAEQGRQARLAEQAGQVRSRMGPLLDHIDAAHAVRRERFDDEFQRRYGCDERPLGTDAASPEMSMN